MSKRSLLVACGMIALSSVEIKAQTNTGLGIHFGAYDFYGPQTGDYFRANRFKYDYNETKGAYDTSIAHRINWKPLVRFTYWKELNRSFSISTGLSLASVDYPNRDKDSSYINSLRYNDRTNRRENFLGELDFRVNYNILPRRDYIVSPYVFAGIAASYHDIFFGADIPLGVGFNIALDKSKDLSLNLESAYKVAATEHNQNHLMHSVGIIYWFKPGYRKTVPPAEVVIPKVTDSDNDGIPDDQDQCPTIAGTAQFNGCPDSDGDGISDKDDACPLVAGLAQFNGCPDTDGDGIADNKDKCPYLAGTSQYDGCPPPDRDHDGVLDDIDRCPDVAGVASNQGCPEIRREVIMQVERAAKAIFFETGKATIKKISFKSLDQVVAVLKSDQSLYADIEGHTDNAQPKTYTNQELSESRAAAVRNYFVSKGIDAGRLTSQGFGESQPVADNATAAGKAQNRRTVIKLRNYSK